MNNACLITSCKWNHLEKRYANQSSGVLFKSQDKGERDFSASLFFPDKNLSSWSVFKNFLISYEKKKKPKSLYAS